MELKRERDELRCRLKFFEKLSSLNFPFISLNMKMIESALRDSDCVLRDLDRFLVLYPRREYAFVRKFA